MVHTEQVFETFESFIEAACKPPLESEHSGHFVGRRDWYGTETFEQAVGLARTGWKEGAEKAAALRASIAGAVNDLIAAKSTSYAYDVAGQWVDVGLHLSGEPECFGVEVEDSAVNSRPVVKLVFNAAASGSVDAGDLIARGVAAVAAIDILESTGRRVEVWLVKGGVRRRGVGTNAIRVLLKKADQPVDVDRIAFALACPACLRRLLFSVQHHAGFHAKRTLPHPVPADRESVLVPHVLRSSGLSRRDLLAQVAEICRQAGVEIEAPL
jgi:hypothetical protein